MHKTTAVLVILFASLVNTPVYVKKCNECKNPVLRHHYACCHRHCHVIICDKIDRVCHNAYESKHLCKTHYPCHLIPLKTCSYKHHDKHHSRNSIKRQIHNIHIPISPIPIIYIHNINIIKQLTQLSVIKLPCIEKPRATLLYHVGLSIP